MNRYDKMVELNRLLSKEKERRAINALIEMKEEGWISVTELTRRTGLSRTYFYKKPEVRKKLDEALRECKNTGLSNHRAVLENGVLQAKLKLLEKEAEKLRAKNRSLEKENKNLKLAMEQLEIEMLHML